MTFTKVLVASIFFFPSLSFAEDADFYVKGTLQIDAQDQIDELIKPIKDYVAIDFLPIQVTFETGERVPLDFQISVEVEGQIQIKKIADIETQLNILEKALNKIGQSIRGLEEYNVFTKLPVDPKKLAAQAKALSEAIRKFDPANMKDLLKDEQFKNLIKGAQDQVTKEVLTSVRQLADESGLEGLKLPELPLPTVLPVAKVEKPQFVADKTRTWRFQKGDAKVILVYGEANLKTLGMNKETSKEVAGSVDGRFGAKLMGTKEFDLAKGFASYASKEKEDFQTAKAYFEILGKEIFRKEFKDKNPSWGDTYRKGVDQSQRFPFKCGPLDCLVVLGARGSAFFTWSAGLAALRAYGKASAGMEADAYATAEASFLDIIGVGAEATLVLMKETVTAEANALLRLDASDYPYINLDINAYNQIQAMAGRVSAYGFVRTIQCEKGSFAGVSYPKCGTKKEKIETPIYEDPGFTQNGNILSFHMKLSPFGSEVTGADVKAEDLEQLKNLQKQGETISLQERENRLAAATNKVNQDLKSFFETMGRELQTRQVSAIQTGLTKQAEQVDAQVNKLKGSLQPAGSKVAAAL